MGCEKFSFFYKEKKLLKIRYLTSYTVTILACFTTNPVRNLWKKETIAFNFYF